MILSNEPGYYKAGDYGIRIENLIAVTAAPVIAGAERTLDAFETLTLAPYDRSLIDPDLLTASERAWIDTYHARVLAELSPHLDATTHMFLAEQTKPLD
jgi:Xaa-Pro aminopeptidase